MPLLACALVSLSLLSAELEPARQPSAPELELGLSAGAGDGLMPQGAGAGVIAAGAVVWMGAYAAAVIPAVSYTIFWPIVSAVTSDFSYSPLMAWLWVPVVGPFLAAAYHTDPSERTMRAFLYADGVLQAVGLGLVVTGALMQSGRAEGEFVAIGPGPGGRPGLTVALAL